MFCFIKVGQPRVPSAQLTNVHASCTATRHNIAGLHAVYDPVASRFNSAKTHRSNCVWLEFVLHTTALQEGGDRSASSPLSQLDL